MIERTGLKKVIQKFVSSLIEEYEKPKVFSVLDRHRANIFEKGWCLFKSDVSEKQGHDECVYEPYFASILETIPQSLEKWRNFLLKAGHVLQYNDDDVKPPLQHKGGRLDHICKYGTILNQIN